MDSSQVGSSLLIYIPFWVGTRFITVNLIDFISINVFGDVLAHLVRTSHSTTQICLRSFIVLFVAGGVTGVIQ